MPRRCSRAVALALLASTVAPAAAVAPVAPVAAAEAPATSTTLAPTIRAKAWIVVDADTGAVVDQHDAHTRFRPASTVKLLTALVGARSLAADEQVRVSARAAGAPANRLGLVEGQTWRFDDLLASLLLVSANDAAVAIAERVSGNLDRFAAELRRAGRQLGLADQPVLDDPAGLDDSTAHGDGSWLSAWDLAIVGRAALQVPAIRSLTATPVLRFTGPDGTHRLRNHNRLLALYDGAAGLKTGYTKQAGNTLVAAATRGGRTMLSVTLGVDDLYGSAAVLLDRGFATAASTAGGTRLPAIHLPDPAPSHSFAVTNAVAPAAAVGLPIEPGRSLGLPLLVLLLASGALVLLRRRVVVRSLRQLRDAGVHELQEVAHAHRGEHRRHRPGGPGREHRTGHERRGHPLPHAERTGEQLADGVAHGAVHPDRLVELAR